MRNSYSGRILVVDDEIEVITPLCDLLSEIGYEANGFVSGKEALEALKKQESDLLLTDLMMPEMDGITLMKAAREIEPTIICIVITGQGTVQTAVEAMKIGAFDYITKPVDWKMLGPVLSRAMEVRHLRKSEERYRAIVEDQTEFVCRFLPDGTLTFVNEAFCRYYGKKQEELIGKSFMQFIPEDERVSVKERCSSLGPGNPVVTYEHRLMKPGGEIRWQHWTTRAILDDKGHLIEIQSVGFDITDRKKAEQELRASRDQLRVLTKRLSQAEETERLRIARELHDQVGQNLTALGINLNILGNALSDRMTGEIDARLSDALSMVSETAKGIRDVMADLRPPVLDDYGLIAAIRWFGEKFSNRTGLRITVTGKEFSPRMDLDAEITLFRIVQEALTNAAKHAKAGNITVMLEESEGAARLEIADDGIGFEPESRSDGRGGWGLLNMRERAEAIGGRVIVESGKDAGTRILIEIKR